MKRIFLPLVCCFFLFACENDNPIEEGPLTGNYDDFQCYDFFVKGDYSGLCFVSGDLPNDSLYDGSVNATLCSYFLGSDTAPLDGRLGVSFIRFGDAAGAMNTFNIVREDLEGEIEDFKIGPTDAYVVEPPTNNENHGKFARFVYKSIMITIKVVYYEPWTPVIPCFWENEELKKLATEIHANME